MIVTHQQASPLSIPQALQAFLDLEAGPGISFNFSCDRAVNFSVEVFVQVRGRPLGTEVRTFRAGVDTEQTMRAGVEAAIRLALAGAGVDPGDVSAAALPALAPSAN